MKKKTQKKLVNKKINDKFKTAPKDSLSLSHTNTHTHTHTYQILKYLTPKTIFGTIHAVGDMY